MTTTKRSGPRVLLACFERLLRLYPAEFYREFGEEMRQVFHDSLDEASRGGQLPGLAILLRELVDLPANLVREYYQMWFHKEGAMETGKNMHQPGKTQAQGWGNPPLPGERRSWQGCRIC
jgi:hypothetical protein